MSTATNNPKRWRELDRQEMRRERRHARRLLSQAGGSDLRLRYSALCPECDGMMFVAYVADASLNQRNWVMRCDRWPECVGESLVHYKSKGTARTRIGRAAVHTGIERIARLSVAMYGEESGSDKAKMLFTIARSRTYRWLAHHLGIHSDFCHARSMELDVCKRASVLLQDATPQQIRTWANRKKVKTMADAA